MNGTSAPALALSALAMGGVWRVAMAIFGTALIWGAVDWALS